MNSRLMVSLRAHLKDFPCVLFLPYLIVYILGYVLNTKPTSLLPIFRGLHVAVAILLVSVIFVRPKPIPWLPIAIITVYFIAFLIPGAYLEYPSDPWEHLRRIFLWNSTPHIRDNPIASRFSYFWAWTMLEQTPISFRRCGLAIYGALAQGLATYQFWRLMLGFGFKEKSALLQTIAFTLLFGTNLFSLRYYALSGTPIGYAAYLAGLLQILQGRFKCRSDLCLLGVNLLVMGLAHPQTLLFFAISTSILLLIEIPRLKQISPRSLARLALLVIVGGVLFGLWMRTFHLEWYARMEYDRFTRWGSFILWDKGSRFLETLGVHGCIALIAGAIFVRNQPKILALSLGPILLLLYPPTALAISSFSHADTAYRILYSFPTSVLLTATMLRLAERLEHSFNPLRGKSFLLANVFIIALAAPYQYPWRGRLFFQFYTPPAERELVQLDQTAAWFSNHSEILKDCWLVTDDATGIFLDSFLGTENPLVSRIPPLRFLARFENFELMMEGLSFSFLHSNLGKRLCGLLITESARLPKVQESKVAIAARHWPPEWGDLKTFALPHVQDRRNELQSRLALHTVPVPPFYVILQPTEKTPSAAIKVLEASGKPTH